MSADRSLRFGEHRIYGGWIGIGIAAAALVLIGATQIAIGDWHAIAAVGPILLIFAAACATTRTVDVDPIAGEVRVNRKLLGLCWTRRWPVARFDRVAVVWSFFLSRHARRDGTLVGDQKFMRFRVMLQGRGRIELDFISGDPDRAESVAIEVAEALGLPAERQDYTYQMVDRHWLAEGRKGTREPL